MPRPDSQPIFSSLLSGRDTTDADVSGIYDVLVEGDAAYSQSYELNTAILVTRVTTGDDSVFEIVDFAPRFSRFGRRYRPVAMSRLIRPVQGTPKVKVRVRPAFGFSATAPQITHGSNHIRYSDGMFTVRLTTDAPLTYILNETWFRLERPISLFLGPDETLTVPVSDTTHAYRAHTSQYWKEWVRSLAIPFAWQDAVIRAAITLKLCWYEETGGIIAAMTTSIPESANSGRNWDYRYCWLRDAYYVIRALNRLGAIDILESYLVYLGNLPDLNDSAHLQPVYGIGLEALLHEQQEEGLAGYRSMGPIRSGNQAHQHFQYDVYGQVILSATQGFFDRRLLRPLTVEDFKRFEILGERAFAVHDSPDAGLWELRTKSRVHTYSSLMCWAACDRLARVAQHYGLADRADYWAGRAVAIKATILNRAWNEKHGHFVSSFGGSDLDASLFQLAELGMIPADDPRFVATVSKLEEQLRRGGFFYRYTEADDFGEPDNAFTFCSFWYIDALHLLGRNEEGREVFEHMLSCRNPLGLLSEHVDINTRELWGNFPQTYALAGIINAATRLSPTWSAML
jgi:GH15 family glucan-1,4-alpha-glucosidase